MELALVSTIDLLLVPLYFIILFFFIILLKKKYSHNVLIQKYLVKGFIFKIFGGLFYALLVVYYWGFGDTVNYFKEVVEIKRLMAEGRISVFQAYFADYTFFRENFGIVTIPNNNGLVVTRLALLLSYFSFSRFLVITMLFSTASYCCLFILFKTFCNIAPKLYKAIAIIVLFIPSMSIYGSGILKDTICMSALSLFFYSVHAIFMKKNLSLKFIGIMIISAYFILVIKSYILAAFLLPLILFVIISSINNIKNSFIRGAVYILSLAIAVAGFYIFSDQIFGVIGFDNLEDVANGISYLQDQYAGMQDNADSNFTIVSIEPSLIGILKAMPAGFVATLYRPFLWEANKIFVLFSALESLSLLLFTLYVLFTAGIKRFFQYFLSNSIIFLSLGFAIIFASIVGLSANNFGTLARYRLPAIPFYLFGLLLILYNAKMEKSKILP